MYRKNEGANTEHRMKRGKLFVLSGPSGVGKGTLREHALNNAPNLKYSISCTTRKPREGETDGIEYRFIERTKFQEYISQGLFLEYAHVHEDYYGTLKRDVMSELESGHDVLLEIDVQGALQVKEKLPEAVLIFVAPPSVEVLTQRLKGRGTENAESLNVRLSNALKEIALKDKYDYVIVNDDLNSACNELRKIILS